MRIAIVSDTHRNPVFINRVLDIFENKTKVHKIYHLGDDYVDSDKIRESGYEVISVPGLYCKEYLDNSYANKIVDTIQGINLILVHAENDLSKEDYELNDIILCGHTHKAIIEYDNGKIYVNPGHLKSEKNKNEFPSYAIIDIDYDNIKIKICDTEGKTIKEMSFRKSGPNIIKA